MERNTPVTPVKIEYVCDECGQAPLQISGNPLPNGKIPHFCPACSALTALDRGYPLISFEETREQPSPGIPGTGRAELDPYPSQEYPSL